MRYDQSMTDSIAYTDTTIPVRVAERLAKNWYADSPFRDLLALPSKSKGAEMERLVEEFMVKTGHTVSKPTSSDHDRIIDGVKTEIKGSSRWGGGNGKRDYRWQQIRLDEDYEQVIWLAIDHNEIRLWSTSKTDLQALDGSNGIALPAGCSFTQQHDPNGVKSEVMWLAGDDQSLHSCGLFREVGVING